MGIALVVLAVLAAADLVAAVVLLGVVWAEHRRVRREAAAAGEAVPPANKQLGCLLFFCLLGIVGLYLSVWLLIS
jgi:hypothetical protein